MEVTDDLLKFMVDLINKLDEQDIDEYKSIKTKDIFVDKFQVPDDVISITKEIHNILKNYHFKNLSLKADYVPKLDSYRVYATFDGVKR